MKLRAAFLVPFVIALLGLLQRKVFALYQVVNSLTNFSEREEPLFSKDQNFFKGYNLARLYASGCAYWGHKNSPAQARRRDDRIVRKV